MAGRRKRPPSHQLAGREALQNIQDTGATTDNSSAERQAKQKRSERYEKVDPPFRASQATEPSFDPAALLPGLKFVGKYVLPVLGFVLTAVWYASKLDSNVDALQVEVKEIDLRTEELMKNSIQHSGRLDSLEMEIDRHTAFQNPTVITKGNSSSTSHATSETK